MVRAAQQGGDLRVLYPAGAERILDIPWFLEVAIEHALTVLNWMENLPKKEVPPQRLWGDGEGLEQWWAKVEEWRSEGGGPASSSSPDAAEGTDNELARAFKQG